CWVVPRSQRKKSAAHSRNDVAAIFCKGKPRQLPPTPGTPLHARWRMRRQRFVIPVIFAMCGACAPVIVDPGDREGESTHGDGVGGSGAASSARGGGGSDSARTTRHGAPAGVAGCDEPVCEVSGDTCSCASRCTGTFLKISCAPSDANNLSR